MASPNSTFTEIVTTTLRNRSGKTADNVSNGNAILSMLKKQGGWQSATGRSIVQELEYSEGNFQWYSGYETITITPPDVFTAAEYDWKQAASSVSISGLEKDVQNTGKEALINLMEARIKNAERTMKNQVTNGMYSDGTGNSGKEIGGLQSLIADDPTASATVGGINQNTYTWWRNQTYDFSTEASGNASASNIQVGMNTLFLRCSRGNDKPNLIVMDDDYFGFFWASMQTIQRVTSTDKAVLGFNTLMFGNTPVVYEDASSMPDKHMYFINTDFLKLRYAPDRLFKPSDSVRPANQDAETVLMLFAGNLTCSNRSLQGVGKN